jgi:hypothetical protein
MLDEIRVRHDALWGNDDVCVHKGRIGRYVCTFEG